MKTATQVYDQVIPNDLDGRVALRIKRAINIIFNNSDDPEHTAFCVGQILLQSYYQGQTDAMTVAIKKMDKKIKGSKC